MKLIFIFLALCGILGGTFYFVGKPFNQEAVEADNQTVVELAELRHKINFYKNINKCALPKALDSNDFLKLIEIKTIQDKIKNGDYVYSSKDNTSYKICANFELDYEERNYAKGYINEFKNYKKGNNCFDLTNSAKWIELNGGYCGF